MKSISIKDVQGVEKPNEHPYTASINIEPAENGVVVTVNTRSGQSKKVYAGTPAEIASAIPNDLRLVIVE